MPVPARSGCTRFGLPLFRVSRGVIATLASGLSKRVARGCMAGFMAVAAAAAGAQAPPGGGGPSIPLCAGLTIVTAISQSDGDYESIKTVEAVDERSVRIKYSAEQMVTDFLADDVGKIRKTTVLRTVRRVDLESARLYQQIFFAGMPEAIPESTAVGTSSTVLGELMGAGRAEMAISTVYPQEITTDRNTRPNIYDYQTQTTIERARPDPVLLPVLVNDEKTMLPAIHAKGDFSGDRAEFFFLADVTNPLTLRFRIGIDAVAPPVKEQLELCETMQSAAPDEQTRKLFKTICGNSKGGDSAVLQVVKISHRCTQAPLGAGLPPAAAELEQALAKIGKVEIYDIHFSFGSAEIRAESEPRLREIAAVLKKHPDWRLSVGGHTDNVGGDADNLALSQRRAAAVKAALEMRHSVAPGRLTTAGYGEAQPRDTNDTLEGRARNRRVELVKS